VSGSYNGNITPLLVSSSTITMGSERCSGARKEYCLSDILLKPVVNTRPERRKIALVALLPSWLTASYSTNAKNKFRNIIIILCLATTTFNHAFPA
jgi:hypothetical protein